PRDGRLGLRALPAVVQEDGDLPGRRRRAPRDRWPARARARPRHPSAVRRVLERRPATNPLFGAFFADTEQAGYPLTADVNGYRQEGFAPFDRNVHRGRRVSAARAYLHPALAREHLTAL